MEVQDRKWILVRLLRVEWSCLCGEWDKNLYAIDAVTGKEKWRFGTGRAVVSSPAVSNGVVYVGSRDNNLYAIDAETGKERWRFGTGEWCVFIPFSVGWSRLCG